MSEDKKTVQLAVSGLAYSKEYTVSAKQILVGGKPVDLPDSKFSTPAVTDIYNLELSTNALGDQVLANGSDNLVLTAKLVDKVTGKVDVNADNVVIEFHTSHGNLANTRVTVQNGEASVTLRSEFSQKDLVVKVDAKVIEASGDYKDLIGEVVGNKEVYFKVKLDDISPDSKPAVVSAGSNQADRVTVNFNKAVTVADFVQYDEKTKKFKVNADGTALLVTGTTIKVSQPGEADRTVLGVKTVDGNPKALEVILAKDSVLTDNREVKVEVEQASNVGPQKTSAEFVLADARKPEATSVVTQDLRTLKVKFSEAISSAEVSLDGGILAIASTEFGDFNPATLEDNRDLLTVKTVDYLTAGVHSIQLSTITDFAGLTDNKNISTSQTLDFKVDADNSVPSATVSVESPEQFRIVFNKQVTGLDDVSKIKLQVAVKNADGTQEWKNVEDTTGKYAVTPTLDIDKVTDSEYVVELQDDWTVIYKTSATAKNYYNDNYRLVIPAKTVVNPANGKQNEDIVLSLNDTIMKTPDTVSPAIKDITEISTGHYNVVMNKPVKLPGKDNEKDRLDTPSESQKNGVPTPIVEFLGKDKDGNTVTIKGSYVDYTDKDKADKQFEVVPTPDLGMDDPQTIVNNGGSTEWTLVVRSISDDVGNTAETLTKKFIIEPTTVVADDVFLVKGKTTANPNYNGVHGYLNGTGRDTITLTFTSGVTYTGSDKNAVNPSNYTLDGENLPKGTILTVEDADNNIKNGYETVIISLPDGTLETSFGGHNVITLTKSLVSYKGTPLTGEYNISFKPEGGIDPVDADAAKAVSNKIAALPANITLANEADVQAARAAYDALKNADVKALVKNLKTLEAAEKKIEDLKKAEGEAGANLQAAKDAVTALETAADKNLTDVNNLTAAEEAVKAAETALAKVAAGEDKDLLQARVTLAKKKVTDARKAFDAEAATNLEAAKTAVTDLETAAGKDLKEEANLTAAEDAVTAAETAVAKVAAGADKTALEEKLAAAKKTVTDARKAFDDLKAALAAAQTAMDDSLAAVKAYEDAGKDTSAPVFQDVTDARTTLNNLLSSGSEDTAAIKNATEVLVAATEALVAAP